MSKRTVRGFGLVLLFVACNGLLSWRLGGLSYSHFTWEAFAQYYYGPTATPTPTVAPTPVATLVPNGGLCAVGTQCASGFCVSGVCCNSACNSEVETCTAPGSVGSCIVQSPASAMSESVTGVLALILVTLGVLSLRRGLARRRPQ